MTLATLAMGRDCAPGLDSGRAPGTSRSTAAWPTRGHGIPDAADAVVPAHSRTKAKAAVPQLEARRREVSRRIFGCYIRFRATRGIGMRLPPRRRVLLPCRRPRGVDQPGGHRGRAARGRPTRLTEHDPVHHVVRARPALDP